MVDPAGSLVFSSPRLSPPRPAATATAAAPASTRTLSMRASVARRTSWTSTPCPSVSSRNPLPRVPCARLGCACTDCCCLTSTDKKLCITCSDLLAVWLCRADAWNAGPQADDYGTCGDRIQACVFCIRGSGTVNGVRANRTGQHIARKGIATGASGRTLNVAAGALAWAGLLASQLPLTPIEGPRLTCVSSSRPRLRRDPGRLLRVRLLLGHPGGVRPGVPQLSGPPFARTR